MAPAQGKYDKNNANKKPGADACRLKEDQKRRIQTTLRRRKEKYKSDDGEETSLLYGGITLKNSSW